MAIAIGWPQPSKSTVEFIQCKVRTESLQKNNEERQQNICIEQLLQSASLTRVSRDYNMNKSETRGYRLATKTEGRTEAGRQNGGPGGTTGDSTRTWQVESGFPVKDGNMSRCVVVDPPDWGIQSNRKSSATKEGLILGLKASPMCVTGMSHKYQQRIISTFYHIV